MLIYLAAIETEEDKHKFEQLYLTYRQVMFYVANGILKDTQLAEDAVHQAFIRVMNHLDHIFDIECPQTKSFMVIIVRNISINLYNSRKRKAVLSFDELANWTGDETEAPLNAVESREGYLHLVDLLGRLPDHYRDVLLLKYDNGYSTAEIAALLELSEENVKKRLQRAKKKLEEILEKEGVSR